MPCFGVVIFMWCQTPALPAAYCDIAVPVRVSHADTRATKEAAAREFAKWKAVCSPKAK